MSSNMTLIFDAWGELVARLIHDTPLPPGATIVLTAACDSSPHRIVKPGIWRLSERPGEFLVSPTFGEQGRKMVASKLGDVPDFADEKVEYAFLQTWEASAPLGGL